MNMPQKLTPPAAAPGINRIWLVVQSNGVRHYMDHEPLEGWVAWTRRSDAKVIEYAFSQVIYEPPPKKTVPPKP